MASGFLLMSFNRGLTVFILGVNMNLVGSSLIMPLVQTVVSENSSIHKQGINLGLMQSFSSFGRILGPISGGFLYANVNYSAPSIMATFGSLLLFIAGFWLNGKSGNLNNTADK